MLRLALALSVIAHIVMSPWRLMPDRNAVKLEDAPGELTLPVDLLGEEPPPPLPPPEPVQPEEPAPVATHRAVRDAGPKPVDAGPDSESLATDAGTTSTDDAGVVSDASVDASDPDASGAIAQADASTSGGVGGPRDPAGMIGVASLPTAGPANVSLLVNISVIRGTPVGSKVGPLLSGIPRWKDVIQSANGKVDPLRDTEWILVSGPSLIDTSRDAIFIRYTAPDSAVEGAVAAVASKYDQGGPIDAGAPGVKAWLAHADGAERVMMRVQPKVLIVVPKASVATFSRAKINPRVQPGEAVRLVLNDPTKQIKILRGVKIDGTISQLRMVVVPRASDGGADLTVEGDCTTEADAVAVADAMNDLISRQNTIVVRALTRGLLNHAHVTADGTHINLRLSASKDQIDSMVQAIGAAIGVDVTGGAPPSP